MRSSPFCFAAQNHSAVLAGSVRAVSERRDPGLHLRGLSTTRIDPAGAFDRTPRTTLPSPSETARSLRHTSTGALSSNRTRRLLRPLHSAARAT